MEGIHGTLWSLPAVWGHCLDMMCGVQDRSLPGQTWVWAFLASLVMVDFLQFPGAHRVQGKLLGMAFKALQVLPFQNHLLSPQSPFLLFF